MRPLRPQRSKGMTHGKASRAKALLREDSIQAISSRKLLDTDCDELPTADFDLWAATSKPPMTLESVAKLPKKKIQKIKMHQVINGEIKVATKVPLKPLRLRSSLVAKKPMSKRRAVQLPHAGTSYNPDEEARKAARDSVAQRLEREIAADKKWQLRIKVQGEVPPPRPRWEVEQGWLDEELKSEIIEKRKPQKKTHQERERLKRKYAKLHKEERMKGKIRFNKQIERIDEIAAKIAEKKAIDEEFANLKKKIKAVKDPVKVHNMGGTRPTEKLMAVLAAKDLKRNLRRQDMSVAGSNPLVDRYDSYLMRHMIPNRKKGTPKPYAGPKRRSFYQYGQ